MTTEQPDNKTPEQYNETYFESGLVAGVSGYMNFGWLPEMTIRMAHKFITGLPISRQETVLDFGCAKGFLVKALRLLDIKAHGADVSEYAIKHVPSEVKEYCHLISGCADERLFERSYDWLLAKDVFEHLNEADMRLLLRRSRPHVKKMFAAIPLAADNESGKYIVPAYDLDVTHSIAKTKDWWADLFKSEGWNVESFNHNFDGCKENWRKWEEGNGFFIVS
ncbi:class I SAM-dependent methyltransferase [Patescibacteria group bacterium]|nr:class I SAM-dependent methyltransferase [Patescibacteria group bacterium]MBU2509431.1 class I SAM-dependent methyltransferase [Patescibacteria group bacterium]